MSDKRFDDRIQIQVPVKCTRRTSKLNMNSDSELPCKIKYSILIVYDMAQPLTQNRTPLGIEPFWEKSMGDPPLKRKKMAVAGKIGSSCEGEYCIG